MNSTSNKNYDYRNALIVVLARDNSNQKEWVRSTRVVAGVLDALPFLSKAFSRWRKASRADLADEAVKAG